MDKCDHHLATYVKISEVDRLVEEGIQYRLECYLRDRKMLIERYSRADTFLKIVYNRILAMRGIDPKKIIYFGDVPDCAKSLRAGGDGVPSAEAFLEVDKILQMGLDFEILLNTMNNDEILAAQWKSIVMTMRLCGHDSFQKEDE